MNRKLLLWLWVLSMGVFQSLTGLSQAPATLLKGKITGKDGLPIAGASVQVKGRSRELTQTDGEGNFTLHTTADVFHSQVWRQQLAKQIESNPQEAENALAAGEHAAKSLWRALDGIEARRTAQAA